MRILTGNNWRDGYLDYHLDTRSLRIAVSRWVNLEAIQSQYFVREKSVRTVINYVREIGVFATLRKIRSRSAEAARNEKFLSLGVGTVIEVGSEADHIIQGRVVGFVAYNHPKCIERVIIDERLVFEIGAGALTYGKTDSLRFLEARRDRTDVPDELLELMGWSPFSGIDLPTDLTASLESARRALENAMWSDAAEYRVGSAVECRRGGELAPSSARGRRSAALFGYGNYAKTMCLPNVSRHVDVTAIHEVDPTQIPVDPGAVVAWDTSPIPHDGDHYDVFLIAGYHHTHAAIAEFALNQNACAVVEKPLVTSQAQLNSLAHVLQQTEGRMFAGFHKRYARFNSWIREDLQLTPDTPVSFHCIVFEVRLPELHWYRWPNSCGRIVANGCHWIDHFLYLNGFRGAVETNVFVAQDQTINCTIVLENGALFTMVLTDRGSERLGVQNNVELRSDSGTVRIFNDSDYFAESNQQILRKRRINRLDSYGRMYREIARRIADDQPGDSHDSLVASSSLILDIERQAQDCLADG